MADWQGIVIGLNVIIGLMIFSLLLAKVLFSDIGEDSDN